MNMDKEGNRESNNLFQTYEFLRSSNTNVDYMKFDNFDYRDSSKQFNENFMESANFLNHMIVDRERFSSSISKDFKARSSTRKEFDIGPNIDVFFEERDCRSSILSLIEEAMSLIQREEFEVALEFLESNALSVVNNYLFIKLTILKLNLFRKIRCDEVGYEIQKIFFEMENILKSSNADFTRHLQILKCLIEKKEVIKSQLYVEKKLLYILRLKKIVFFCLTYSDASDLPESALKDRDAFEEDVKSILDLDEELIFYSACFYKSKRLSEGFDNFLESLNPPLVYDKRNSLSNSIIIDDFLQECADNRKDKEILKQIKFHISPDSKPATNNKVLKPSPNNFYMSFDDLDAKNLNNETISMGTSVDESKETETSVKNKAKKHTKLNSLKNFTFKYLKKENIDKKTLRKFRKYLCVRIKQLDPQMVSKVILDFSNSLMFPPFTFQDISFKSFNSSYLIWLFSNKEIYDLFEEYIELSLNKLVEFLVHTFKVEDKEEITTLEQYLKKMAIIYSNCTVKGSTIIPQVEIEMIKRNSAVINVTDEFMRLSVEKFSQLLPCTNHTNSQEKKSSVVSNFNSQYVVEHKKSSLRMSTQQREELISKLYEQYTVDD